MPFLLFHLVNIPIHDHGVTCMRLFFFKSLFLPCWNFLLFLCFFFFFRMSVFLMITESNDMGSIKEKEEKTLSFESS
jgi:hypothetical protein